MATSATPIALHVFGDFAASPRATFDHHGADRGAVALLVPRVRADDASTTPGETTVATHDTWIAVANVSAASVDVTVRYAGLGGGCAGLVATHGDRAFAIPAGASLLFGQGADGAGFATGASGLPPAASGPRASKPPERERRPSPQWSSTSPAIPRGQPRASSRPAATTPFGPTRPPHA